MRQVVAARTKMVVDDVLDHSQTGSVTGINELHVAERASISLVYGVPMHAVVAPVVRTVESVYRHQLDEVDPELHEVVEPVDRRRQRALGGECTDVQLVDDAAGKLLAGPLLVWPGELVRIERPRPAV